MPQSPRTLEQLGVRVTRVLAVGPRVEAWEVGTGNWRPARTSQVPQHAGLPAPAVTECDLFFVSVVSRLRRPHIEHIKTSKPKDVRLTTVTQQQNRG